MSPEGVNGNRCSESSTLLEKYKIGKVIGDGNFAVVKECMDRSTGKEFALKIIDKAKCCGKEHLIENEVSILRRVKHPNIIMLVEEMETATELFLVMELVKVRGWKDFKRFHWCQIPRFTIFLKALIGNMFCYLETFIYNNCSWHLCHSFHLLQADEPSLLPS